ncbi:MAG: cysteine desulfurase NifS [Actinobacteria bacterium HGW-Actinobacteria-1]|jgi:cysteine desulfurase|nr:MAG: cysteine desulfurase NifS [Actinobacteria bacterium HGW-Actinobacteria-1]
MTERRIYLDNAATTRTDPRVVAAMEPYFTETYGNANSLHAEGRAAHKALEDARARVASAINASRPDEVLFTSGGTESDNSALIGLATAGGRTSGHIVVSAFEHHAVLEPAEWLGKHGFDVTLLKPRPNGVVHADDLKDVLRDDTIMVSVMHGNNELGTVQPIAELATAARERGALFHTDAAQTLGKVEFDVAALGVDAASFSGHKIYGPKGTGVLFLKKGLRFAPYLMGGGQEFRKRSGTQNVPGAQGFATALEIMAAEREAETIRLTALRDRFEAAVVGRLENTYVNGTDAPRMPHLTSLIVKGVEGESMLLHLDAKGIAVSTGSACSSGSLQASHVLMAIDCPQEIAHGSLRVSLGRWTTEADIDCLVDALIPIVERLRAMSPVYEKMFGASGA